MTEFEKYLTNLDINDNEGLKDVNVDKTASYRGPIDSIIKDVLVDDPKIPPLAAAIVGLNNTGAPLPTETNFYTAWSDIDAQEIFLNAKPTCYLILSKPGTGAFTLGEAISKKFHCMHLCPRSVLMDEIDQKSQTGRCLDFNMRHNKTCKFDVILPIIKQKLESPTIKHRGYVLSGLPLVTSSWSEKYLISSLNGEESLSVVDDLIYDVLVNLKKKKPKVKKAATESSVTSLTSGASGEEVVEQEEEHVPEEERIGEEQEEPPVALPTFLLETCSDIISVVKTSMHSKKVVLLSQFKQVMDLPMKPDIIIYITCPDKDAVYKKEHTFLDYISKTNTHESMPAEISTDLRWPVKYSISDSDIHLDKEVFRSKYNCRQPMNYKENSIQQMCIFRKHLLTFIENKLQEFDPKHIIKLDGCTTVDQMMHQISEKLLLLPINPVLVPTPLMLEDAPEEMAEFWQFVNENMIIAHCNGVRFNRYPSPWYNRCPVELKNRQSILGNPRYAVALFRHVYVMSSLPSMIQFFKNPRPYLKMKYLEPTCRAIIMGTKSSGKSMISKCLSWLFDAQYICYNTFLEIERQKKIHSYSKSILSEIIATIEDERLIIWQSAESERMRKQNDWYKLTLKSLREYYPLLLMGCVCSPEISKCPSGVIPTVIPEIISKVTEEEMMVEGEIDQEGDRNLKEELHVEEQVEKQVEKQKEPSPIPSPPNKMVERYKILRKELSFIPYLDDVQQVNEALSNKFMLLLCAPSHLITPTLKPAIPAMGDTDVMNAINKYIVSNDLHSEIEPTPEELITEMVRILSEIDANTYDETNNEKQYGRWVIDGFPGDPELWGFLSASNFMPDYTIALIENREIDQELMYNYMIIRNSVKDYEERFTLANDPLIKIKLQTKKLSDAKLLHSKIILHNYLDSVLNLILGDPSTPDLSADVSVFSESVDKFREDWDGVKSKLEMVNKCFIEIELENKSDVEVTEEVLLKLRQCYYLPCVPEEEGIPEDDDNQNESGSPYFLCDTHVYCPITFLEHGVLWQGKPEFAINYNNRVHFFAKDVCLNQTFVKDATKYTMYNKPFKNIPCLRICVMGCIGSGKSTISKYIAKELGLVYVDFADIINEYLMPRHFKKVGRKYESMFTDTPIDEDADATELLIDEETENLEATLFSNENELRRLIDNYLERGSPLLSLLMQKLLKKLWFQKPFLNTGFVLDGFPKLPTDVEDMMACYCIPDLIIEIEGSSEVAVQRRAQQMFKKWKTQMNEAKAISKSKFKIKKQEWLDFITKNLVVKLLCEEIIEAALPADAPVTNPSGDTENEPEAEPVSEPEPVQPIDTLEEAYNDIIQEFPEPVDLSEWEKPSDVQERIESRVEGTYETDDENIQTLKDIVLEQKIKSFSVNNTKPLYKVLRIVLSKLDILGNRNGSLLEQTLIIEPDQIKNLLSEGYLFLSKFNRMCPVYIFENPDTILNPYKLMQSEGKVYAVGHRTNLYFIQGMQNFKSFLSDPLKYISNNNIKNFIPFPLRISVIGTPKCGKSTLSIKLAQKYGLLCISRGMVLRYVLEHLHWTELASKMRRALNEGRCIETDLIIKAVQVVVMEHSSFTNGFVFDGFPDSSLEAMELLNIGLYPLIVFDISSYKETVLNNSQVEVYWDILKYKPPYARPFIENTFTDWSEKCNNVREWVRHDLQNMYVLDGNKSRWQCLQNAVNRINWIMPRIHNNLIKSGTEITSAGVMCISNKTFEDKMSNFKNMCPVCLRKNVLRHNSFPVDKEGVVQFENKYYWICPEHTNMVFAHPNHYLTATTVNIPEIPAVVKTISASFVYENGVCIVSYAESLPAQKIERGSSKFAANFQGKTYLFCSDYCLKKFLAKPQLYYNVVVFKNAKIFSPPLLKNLPHIGYLEQTLGNVITEACCSVNVLRPKYPGLNVKLSGLLHIALYLKTHNAVLDKAFKEAFLKSFTTYEARCKLMINVGLRLRTMDNPFAKYPSCCSKKRLRTILSTIKGTSISALVSDFHS